MRIRLLVMLVPLACLAACGGSPTNVGLLYGDGDGGTYLALGDSIAAGGGASDEETTDYVALVAAVLRDRLGEIDTRSLAEGGHTTQDLIDQQLVSAEAMLVDENVRLVTLTIGGNDLNVLINDPANAASCIQDVEAPPCPVPEILVATEERLNAILGRLRDAGPDVTIAIQAYPNLYSGTGIAFEQPAEQAFGLVNDVIARVAARYGVLIADPREAFAGRGGDLTHVLETPPDSHPNDEGYRVIADAFLRALELD